MLSSLSPSVQFKPSTAEIVEIVKRTNSVPCVMVWGCGPSTWKAETRTIRSSRPPSTSQRAGGQLRIKMTLSQK